MTIKTDMLRYFVEVAQTGNLSKAAKSLKRSPAAVSMMLKQFEGELGSPLFETDRKNRLTALGEFTLEEAKRELAHFDSSVSAIKKFAESGEGRVRVASMPAAVANLLPHVIDLLHEVNPKILVDVDDMTNDAIIDKIRREEADIGIVNSFMIAGSGHIKSKVIMSDRMGVLCARDSLLGRKETLYWSDLATASIVHHALCEKIDEPAVRRATENSMTGVSSALSIQSFVRGGKYVSPMPELGGLALPSDLIFRIPEGNAYWRDVYLVWNEDQNQSPASKRFCKILVQAIADLGMSPKSENGDLLPPVDLF